MTEYMDIKEFREKGILQEINRRLLHPLGLAMFVKLDDQTGKEELGGILVTDDPEGWVFDEIDAELCQKFLDLQEGKIIPRLSALGYLIDRKSVV